MTVDEVHAAVAAIDQASGDPETAHGLEDDLRRDVLRAIANGAPDGAALAAAALQTEEFDFDRWCA